MDIKLFSIILFFACFICITSCKANESIENLPPPPGGQCKYQNYHGVAEIVSVELKHRDDDKYEIWFIFHPDEPVEQDFAWHPGKKYKLLMQDFSAPRSDIVDKYNIAPGQKHECIMKVIIKGTCSPVLFDFPGLNLTVRH